MRYDDVYSWYRRSGVEAGTDGQVSD